MTCLRKLCLRSAVAAVALLAGLAAPARADFLLDDFSSPNPGTVYSGNSSFSPVSLGNGWSRSADVTLLSGSAVTGVLGTDPRPSSLGTVFEQSTPAAATAFSQVSYTPDAGPVNWSASGDNVTGVTTAFTFADLSVPYSVVLNSAAGSSTFTGTVTGPGSYTAAIGDFTGTADLTAITGMNVVLNRNVNTNSSTTSADFVLDDVTVNNNPVPAPPAALLALAALPVFGLRRLLRKKA